MRKLFRVLTLGSGSLIALLLVFGAIAVACSSSDSSGGAENGGDSEQKQSGPLAIGQSAKVGDAEVTLNGVRILTNQFLPADPGHQHVAADFTVVNTGDDEYNMSSLLQFEALDADARKYTVTFHTDAQGSLDGTIPAGGTQRGEVVFELPVDKVPYKVRFTQAFGSQMAEWSVQP